MKPQAPVYTLRFSPHKRISEISQQEIVLATNKCFAKEGLPVRIKIDNGKPLVNPRERDVPTLAVIWWVGLGIEVVKNKPVCPEQNGTVERLQGVLNNWANPAAYSTVEELQCSVDEARRIQRHVFLVPAKGYETRSKLYPELENNPRKYRSELFDIKKVWAYLSNYVWERALYKNGIVKLFGNEIYVSNKLKSQSVWVTFDHQEGSWMIRDRNGALLKSTKTGVITEKTILDFINLSKN